MRIFEDFIVSTFSYFWELVGKRGKIVGKCDLLCLKLANLNSASMIVANNLPNTDSMGFEIIRKIIARFTHDYFVLIVLFDDLDRN